MWLRVSRLSARQTELFMYISMHVCMRVWVHVCVYVYMYIYILIFNRTKLRLRFSRDPGLEEKSLGPPISPTRHIKLRVKMNQRPLDRRVSFLFIFQDSIDLTKDDAKPFENFQMALKWRQRPIQALRMMIWCSNETCSGWNSSIPCRLFLNSTFFFKSAPIFS